MSDDGDSMYGTSARRPIFGGASTGNVLDDLKRIVTEFEKDPWFHVRTIQCAPSVLEMTRKAFMTAELSSALGFCSLEVEPKDGLPRDTCLALDKNRAVVGVYDGAEWRWVKNGVVVVP